jgi:hypothetical protein
MLHYREKEMTYLVEYAKNYSRIKGDGDNLRWKQRSDDDGRSGEDADDDNSMATEWLKRLYKMNSNDDDSKFKAHAFQKALNARVQAAAEAGAGAGASQVWQSPPSINARHRPNGMSASGPLSRPTVLLAGATIAPSDDPNGLRQYYSPNQEAAPTSPGSPSPVPQQTVISVRHLPSTPLISSSSVGMQDGIAESSVVGSVDGSRSSRRSKKSNGSSNNNSANQHLLRAAMLEPDSPLFGRVGQFNLRGSSRSSSVPKQRMSSLYAIPPASVTAQSSTASVGNDNATTGSEQRFMAATVSAKKRTEKDDSTPDKHGFLYDHIAKVWKYHRSAGLDRQAYLGPKFPQAEKVAEARRNYSPSRGRRPVPEGMGVSGASTASVQSSTAGADKNAAASRPTRSQSVPPRLRENDEKANLSATLGPEMIRRMMGSPVEMTPSSVEAANMADDDVGSSRRQFSSVTDDENERQRAIQRRNRVLQATQSSKGKAKSEVGNPAVKLAGFSRDVEGGWKHY